MFCWAALPFNKLLCSILDSPVIKVNISVREWRGERKQAKFLAPQGFKNVFTYSGQDSGPRGTVEIRKIRSGAASPKSTPDAKINKGTFARASRWTCIIYEGVRWLERVARPYFNRILLQLTQRASKRRRDACPFQKKLVCNEWTSLFCPKSGK